MYSDWSIRVIRKPKKPLLKLLLILALLAIVTFTVGNIIAKAAIASSMDTLVKCEDLPYRYSIRPEYKNGAWVVYTEDGPSGVDGGLIEIMTSYQTCLQ